MAKIVCCDNCKSINIEDIGEEKRDKHMTKKSGFWGKGGSYTTDYIEHYSLYKKYKCKDCGCEFYELDYNC